MFGNQKVLIYDDVIGITSSNLLSRLREEHPLNFDIHSSWRCAKIIHFAAKHLGGPKYVYLRSISGPIIIHRWNLIVKHYEHTCQNHFALYTTFWKIWKSSFLWYLPNYLEVFCSKDTKLLMATTILATPLVGMFPWGELTCLKATSACTKFENCQLGMRIILKIFWVVLWIDQ